MNERERLQRAVRDAVGKAVDMEFWGVVDLTVLTDSLLRAGVSPSTGEDDLNAAYRERNAVVAALIRTNGWPRWVSMAPDADGWVIVYAETPEGQVSWHVGPGDFDLIEDFPSTAVRPWDGHTNDEKYARIAALVSPSTGEDRPTVAIRATHPYGFRSGEWAEVTGIEWANDRPCYRVRFPDGRTDSWVVADPSDPYEFRAALTPTGDTPKGEQ